MPETTAYARWRHKDYEFRLCVYTCVLFVCVRMLSVYVPYVYSACGSKKRVLDLLELGL